MGLFTRHRNRFAVTFTKPRHITDDDLYGYDPYDQRRVPRSAPTPSRWPASSCPTPRTLAGSLFGCTVALPGQRARSVRLPLLGSDRDLKVLRAVLTSTDDAARALQQERIRLAAQLLDVGDVFADVAECLAKIDQLKRTRPDDDPALAAHRELRDVLIDQVRRDIAEIHQAAGALEASMRQVRSDNDRDGAAAAQARLETARARAARQDASRLRADVKAVRDALTHAT